MRMLATIGVLLVLLLIIVAVSVVQRWQRAPSHAPAIEANAPPAMVVRAGHQAVVRSAEFVRLADQVMDALELTFSRIDLLECWRGREDRGEEFTVALARLQRDFPPGADEEVDRFTRAAGSAVAGFRHLCSMAALGKVHEAQTSVEEIFRDKAAAVAIIRDAKAAAR